MSSSFIPSSQVILDAILVGGWTELSVFIIKIIQRIYFLEKKTAALTKDGVLAYFSLLHWCYLGAEKGSNGSPFIQWLSIFLRRHMNTQLQQ